MIKALLARQQYIDAVRADSPLAFWPLNEPSGSTATDLIGARNATYRNSPTLQVAGPSHRIPHGITVNGSSQVADTADQATFAKQTSGAWSIEAWVRYTDSGSSIKTFMIWRGTTAANQDEVVGLCVNNGAAGRISLNVPTGAASRFNIHSDGSWNDGRWHHVVGTGTAGGAAVLYVDGVQRGTDSTSRYANNSNARRVGIGANIASSTTFSQFFSGSVAAAAIYGSPLSSARVAAHYAAGI